MSLYSLFIYTVPFLGVLTFIVFFHEMGHFLVGRACGAKVDAFSIGFGPELMHYVDRKGTRWRLALLPLGGYVKFHGDANGASVMDPEAIAKMPKGEREQTLFGMSIWKRALTVGAGPAVNFVLAIVLFAGLFYFNGRMVITPEIGAVRPASAAADAGFQAKDLIVSVDGEQLESFEDMQRIVQTGDGSALTFVVRRDGKDVTIVATPRRQISKTLFGDLRTNVLGVQADASAENVHLLRTGLLESVRRGALETWINVENTGRFLKGIFAGRESADQLAGPIRIAQVSGKIAQLGIAPLINLCAILSISIGLLNLLPIPLLDGGFLLFFAIEAIRGRPLKEKTMEVGFRIGLTLVAILSIFVAFNDSMRLWTTSKPAQTQGQAPAIVQDK